MRSLGNVGRLAFRAGSKNLRQMSTQDLPKYGQYHIPTSDQLVNFQIGQPSPSMLPLDLIRECAGTKLAETDPLLLQYGYIPGYPAFRKSLAKFLTSRYACDVTDEEVFATTGVTGGLSLICNLFLNAGDDVFAEDPTYFLAMRIFEDFNLNVTQIPMEQNGLDLDALEDRLKGGHIPKALYTIPTAHNPTGRTLAEEKRGRLCELSEQYGFLVIADEVYHMLTFPDVTPPLPLPEFDKGGKVLSLGSFSKILAPALRMGWVQSKNPELLDVMAQCGQLDSSGGMNPVMSAVVHEVRAALSRSPQTTTD